MNLTNEEAPEAFERGIAKRKTRRLGTILAAAAAAVSVLGFLVDRIESDPEVPTRTDAQRFLVEYFEDVVSEESCCWERLHENYIESRPGGRPAYDLYWSTVRQVLVENVEPTDRPGDFSADLTINYLDGTSGTAEPVYTLVCPENTRFPIIRCTVENMQIFDGY